jgi:NADH-quinone oxidoreductase subunit H
MTTFLRLAAVLFFPSGLFLLAGGLAYEWIDRKLLAQLQNRVGPRWFQPLADVVKLLAKETILPEGANPFLAVALPLVALAGVLTAALHVPLAGVAPSLSYPGDLVVALYLLSLPTLCLGVAGSNTRDRFSLVGATRALTQFFSYEAPFLLALLGPAFVAGSWQIGPITDYTGRHWLALAQPLGFLAALIGLMGKLEIPPFDAPEAETEIVAGPLTEYSGPGLALFRLAKDTGLLVGLALIAGFYLGGVDSLLAFFAKTLALLVVLVGVRALLARLRIDQVVGLWWRYGALLVLVQWLVLILWGRLVS